MSQTGLIKAIKYFGSQGKLAKVLGVTQQAVNHWLNCEQEIPLKQMLRILMVCEGYVTLNDFVTEPDRLQEMHKMLYLINLYDHFPAIKISIHNIQVNQSFCSIYQDKNFLFDNPEQFATARPLLVDTNNHLITCICRLRAHQQAGNKKILVHPIHLQEVLQGKISLNNLLMQFPISEKISIGMALEQTLGNRQGQRNDLPQLQHISTEVTRGVQTRTITAKLIGFKNHFLYVEAKFVMQKGIAELIQAMDSQLLTISKAKKIAELPVDEQYQLLNTYYGTLRDNHLTTHSKEIIL